MSKKKTVIAVYPPLFLNQCDKESEEITGFECPYCHGNKKFTSMFPDEETQICPVCNGLGKIKAKITIKWEPDGKNENRE
jgi:hypothetical protein